MWIVFGDVLRAGRRRLAFQVFRTPRSRSGVRFVSIRTRSLTISTHKHVVSCLGMSADNEILSYFEMCQREGTSL